jgi:hypothetical protein
MRTRPWQHGAITVVVTIASKVESLRRYAVGRVEDGVELDTLVPLAPEEDAEEVLLLMVCIVKLGVSEKDLPLLIDRGEARWREDG